MANRKLDLYRELKELGGPVTRPYNQYNIAVLEGEVARARELGSPGTETDEEPVTDMEWSEPEEPSDPDERIPVSLPDPDELPNQRINTKDEESVIRVDEQGRRWLQEEVRKPAYPKPRGRRVLTYLETGVKTETVQNGEYVETFEVAGDRATRPSEVKITLPSYQVGIYRDPRFPFRVHCYNGQEGFNLHDVNDFYGGSELVPYGVKRIYIENDLCYDIRSVVQAINSEYRQIQLTGKAYQ